MPRSYPQTPKLGIQQFTPALFVFLWSTGFIGAKYGLPYAEPLSFLIWRYMAILLIMLALVQVSGVGWKAPRSTYAHLAVSGSMVHGAYLGGVFVAISKGLPAGLVSLVVGMQPLLTALLAPWVLGERVKATQWLGLLLGLTGVGLVLSARITTGFSLQGLPAALVALCGITVGTLYQKRKCPQFEWRTGSVMQFVGGTVVTLPVMLLTEQFQVQWTGEFAFALAWQVLVLSFGAITLLNVLIRRGSAVNMASLFYLVPPTTAVIAWLLFNETLTSLQIAGFAVAVAGVALARR